VDCPIVQYLLGKHYPLIQGKEENLIIMKRINKYRERHSYHLLLLSLVLSLLMCVPLAASGATDSFTLSNPYCGADNDLNITINSNGNVSSGDTILLTFPSSTDTNRLFDLSSVSGIQFHLNGIGGILPSDHYTINNNEISIVAPVPISSGQVITIKVSNIKNPAYCNDYYYVSISSGTSISYSNYLQVLSPKLVLTKDQDTVETHLRDKITISLANLNDVAYQAPFDVSVDLATDKNGKFCATPADEPAITQVIIPAGQTSVDVYYEPYDDIGLHTLTATTDAFGAPCHNLTTVEVTSTVAEGINRVIWIEPADPYFEAGKPGKVLIHAGYQDQYNNQVDLVNTGDSIQIEVDLITENGSDTGRFIAEPNPEAGMISTVTIPAGQTSAEVYYYDTKATTTSDYSVTLHAKWPISLNQDGHIIGDREASCGGIVVRPGPSVKPVLESAEENGSTTGMAYLPLALNVYLVDQFGNMAEPQPGDLQLLAYANAGTRQGGFFSSFSQDYIERVSQITLPQTCLEQLDTSYYFENTSYSGTVASEIWNIDSEMRSFLLVYSANNYSDWVKVKLCTQAGAKELGPYYGSKDSWIEIPQAWGRVSSIQLELYNYYSSVTRTASIPQIEVLKNSPKTRFFYLDPEAGTDIAITAKTNYLQLSDPFMVNIVPTPAKVVLTPQTGTWAIQNRGEVLVELKNADDTPYTIPAAYSQGLDIGLGNNAPGTFWSAAIDGENLFQNEQYPYSFVHIPAGLTPAKVKVYFEPFEAGSCELGSWVCGPWEGEDIKANFTVSTQSAVNLFLDMDTDPQPCIIAGVPKKFTVGLHDQYGNNVNAGSPTILNLLMKDSNPLATGATGFFYAINTDGSKGNTIDTITIAQGKSSAQFYYVDTRATYPGCELADGRFDRDLKIGAGSLAFDPVLIPVSVTAAAPDKISMGIIGFTDVQLRFCDLSSSPGSWDVPINIQLPEPQSIQLLSGINRPMPIAIVDKYGNPGAQTNPLTINLPATTAPLYGKFYEFNMEAPRTTRITQVRLAAGEWVKTVSFAADGVGTGELSVNAGGLTGNLNIAVLKPSTFNIYFLSSDNGKWIAGSGNAQKNNRIRVLVGPADAAGHPAYLDKDITINLSGASFFANSQTSTEITQIVIPAGYWGAMLWVATGSTEGNLPLSASTTVTGFTAGTAQLTVGNYPYWCTSINRGWNIISTPMALASGKDTLNQVVANPDDIKLAYYWNGSTFLQIYKSTTDGKWYVDDLDAAKADLEYKFKPMDAIYVMTRGGNQIKFWAADATTGPYVKTLQAGWNLVGVAIDLSSCQNLYGSNQFAMPASNYFTSVSDKYSQVVSPNMGQSPWAYVPGTYSAASNDYYEQFYPVMAGRGYWVFLKSSNDMAGFSYTPVKNIAVCN